MLGAEPDPSFVTTENPVDMRLAAAANATSGPEDPTALLSADAERYDTRWTMDRQATLAALDPQARKSLEALSAMREAQIMAFAQLRPAESAQGARSYNGENGTTAIVIDRTMGRDATELWALLYENSTVNVNVAAVASGAAGANASCPPSDAAVLDVSFEAPYDERVFVDASLAEEGLGPDEALRDPDTLDLYFVDVNAALRYAYGRTGAADAGHPLQIGIFLKPGMYYQSVNASWDLPAVSFAAGARIWIRSLSGLRQGTNSAEDTILTCGGMGHAISLSHASPLVSFLGVSIAKCGAVESSTRVDASRSGAAVSVVGLKDIVFRNIIFARNGNQNASADGRGGAVALFAGASAAFENCIFVQNDARRGGGAVAVLDGSEARFEGCVFSSNSAPIGGAVLVSGARAASFLRTGFQRNAAVPPPEMEDDTISASIAMTSPAAVEKWLGGAVAVQSATEAVRFDVAIFEGNAAHFGAAISAASRVVVTRSQVSGSNGGAVWVRSTEARLELTAFSGNENVMPLAAGAVACSGAGASLSVFASTFDDNWGVYGGAARVFDGCRANTSLSAFSRNVALAGSGGAVMVGQAADPGSAVASTWASFDQVEFRENVAGFQDEGQAAEFEADPTLGSGGALALLAPLDGAVPISGCLFAKNRAALGGGLFANASVRIDGDTIFFSNEAGFPWFDAHAQREVQIGGGALLAFAAAPNHVGGALFALNKAHGAFGGGLAMLGGSLEIRGPRFLSNAVLGPDSQGGGIFAQNTIFLGDPRFVAAGNSAEGTFQNVYLLGSGGSSGAANGTASGAAGVVKSCASCSACQACEPATGRCKFPADFEAWCEAIGGCSPETCPFVSAGTARFDETDGLRSIRVELDAGPGAGAGAGAASANVNGSCASFFVPDTLRILGEGAYNLFLIFFLSPETCPFVSAGTARFDETDGLRSIRVELDAGPGAGAGAGAASANVNGSCASFFVPDTLRILGEGAYNLFLIFLQRTITHSISTGTGELIVRLGGAFSVEPGAVLGLQLDLLPQRFRSVSNSAVVEIEQTSIPVEQLKSQLAWTNRTLAAELGQRSGFAAFQTGPTPADASSSTISPGAIVAIALGSAAAVLAVVWGVLAWRRLSGYRSGPRRPELDRDREQRPNADVVLVLGETRDQSRRPPAGTATFFV
eukprot:tig00021572_g22416.t1